MANDRNVPKQPQQPPQVLPQAQVNPDNNDGPPPPVPPLLVRGIGYLIEPANRPANSHAQNVRNSQRIPDQPSGPSR